MSIESILKKNKIEIPRETRPLYQGDYKDILEINQREFGITKVGSIKPVLATYGLATCIGFAGWDSEQKSGFLAHYDFLTKLPESFDYLIYCISNQICKQSKFDVRIIGGWDKSDLIIDFLKSRLDKNSEIKMKLVEEDTGMSRLLVRSVALDTRTGQIYSYFPKLNPLHEKSDPKPSSLFYPSIAKLQSV